MDISGGNAGDFQTRIGSVVSISGCPDRHKAKLTPNLQTTNQATFLALFKPKVVGGCQGMSRDRR